MTLSQPNMNEHSIEWIPKKFVFFGIKSLVLRQSKNPSQISSVTARINVPNVINCIVRVWHRWNAYIKNKKMIIGVCWYIFSLLLLCVLFFRTLLNWMWKENITRSRKIPNSRLVSVAIWGNIIPIVLCSKRIVCV